MLVFTGRDRVSVPTIIEPSLRNYFSTLSHTIRPETFGSSDEEFDKISARLRDINYETVDSLMGIFGEPEYCIDRIAESKERFGFTRIGLLVRDRWPRRPSERARRDAPVRRSGDAALRVSGAGHATKSG
jgi:hypothetical protein